MRVVGSVLALWLAWRWLGFFLGIARISSFERGPVRSEARRAVLGRAAVNVFLSVVVLLLWAAELGLQPGRSLIGFLAAAVMCSLLIGVAMAFMQPQERDPRTIEICRVLRRPPD